MEVAAGLGFYRERLGQLQPPRQHVPWPLEEHHCHEPTWLWGTVAGSFANLKHRLKPLEQGKDHVSQPLLRVSSQAVSPPAWGLAEGGGGRGFPSAFGLAPLPRPASLRRPLLRGLFLLLSCLAAYLSLSSLPLFPPPVASPPT